jgi:DNA (cytosine-5)-methyltransferase 1
MCYSTARYLGPGKQGQTEIRWDGLGPTIRSEHHGNIEYRRLSAEHRGIMIDELNAGLKERRLTPRECALIQTFPPDYEFVMRHKDKKLSQSGAYRVIGNAVPPVLAYKISQHLSAIWNKLF